MKRIVITGATGFVGANLARRLLRDGHRLWLLVRPGYERWRIAELASEVEFVEISLEDYERLRKEIAAIAPDWIFHLAAHGAYSWQTDFRSIVSTNVTGTMSLVEACCQSGFEAFVNTGSSSEYGFKDHPARESDCPEPNSCYAVAKLAASNYCQYKARALNLWMPTLRLYSVYGPYEEPNRLMPMLAMKGLQGELPALVDPSVARDYVYVQDVVEAYLAAAQLRASDPGAIYNVGTGVQTSLAELVDVALKILTIDTKPKWGSMPNRNWDTSVWVADTAKIKEELGWQARTPLLEGFDNLVKWLANQPQMQKLYAEKISSTFSGYPAAKVPVNKGC